MKATNNNKLRQGALFALFITSYIPLFLIVIAKQLKDGRDYLCWGGWKTGLIDGLDNVEEELKTNTSLHKKLVKLQQNGGLESLDIPRIKKMAKVCRRYGEKINIGDDGHVKIGDRRDFETVIKAMCDYYKKGEVSGKSYGTFSGRELKEVEA